MFHKPARESSFFLLKIYLFIFLAVLGLRGCASFSLAAEIRGYSLVAMLGLLTVEASLKESGSIVVVHRFSCSATCVSSQTKDQTSVSCIGRQILYH